MLTTPPPPPSLRRGRIHQNVHAGPSHHHVHPVGCGELRRREDRAAPREAEAGVGVSFPAGGLHAFQLCGPSPLPSLPLSRQPVSSARGGVSGSGPPFLFSTVPSVPWDFFGTLPRRRDRGRMGNAHFRSQPVGGDK